MAGVVLAVVACAPTGAAPGAALAEPHGASEVGPRPALTVPSSRVAQPTQASGAAASSLKAELDRLYDAARQEGKLVLYSSMTRDASTVVFHQFAETFPGVKVEHVRATGRTLQERLLAEARAGGVAADVLDTNAFHFHPVIQAGLLEAYAVPAAQDLATDVRDERGYWTTSRVNAVVIAYNTRLASPTSAPQTWESLAHPAWRRRLVIDANDQELLITLAKQKFSTEESAMELFRGIAANEPEVQLGRTQAAEALVAGRAAVCMGCDARQIVELKKRGEPVDFVRKEGVLNTTLLGLVKGASHPNAARLFLNWMLSEGGQYVLEVVGRIPVRPVTELSAPMWPAGMRWYASRPEYAADRDRYGQLWRELLMVR